jgi:hypothetical protein
MKSHRLSRRLSALDIVPRKKVVLFSGDVSEKSSLSGTYSGILENKCEDPRLQSPKSSPSISQSPSKPPKPHSPLSNSFSPEPDESQNP